jgi:hypothetical protein
MMMETYNLGPTILNTLGKASQDLATKGIKAQYLWVSPKAHEFLANELKERNGGHKPCRIFEVVISGRSLAVLIDFECPNGGAYLEGEE